MSGFVGVLRRDGSAVEDGVLDGMLDQIAHRGPDGTGRWTDGPVGLGHQRLCTTPESGRLLPPVQNADGTVVLTGDYRIDNRPELLDRLGIDDTNLSDGELLVAAYERWGSRCPEELVGPFAFVIWDATRSRLFCARDHLGVKPFYLHESDDILVFGSEASPVLTHPAVSTAVDEVRIGEYLLKRWPDCRRTFYSDVRRHPPAHTLLVEPDHMSERRYWQLDPQYELGPGSDGSFAREFRRRFDEAVRCRLRGVDEPAVTLSGGLDSSSVAGVVREQCDGAVHTFSNVFREGSDAHEREFLDAMLETGEFESHFIDGDDVDPLHRLELRVEIQDAPIWPAMYWHMFEDLAVISSEGHQVMLDGWGGDQVVSHGHERLRQLVKEGRLLTLVSQTQALRTEQDYSLRSQLWNEAVAPFAPEPFRRLWRTVRQPDMAKDANPSVAEEYIQQISLREHLRKLRDETDRSRTHREAHREQVVDPCNVRMLELIDRIAAWHGIESRHPFIDRRLVEFCVAMPADQKLRDGYDRYVLRNALDDVLPDPVRTRTTKAGFGMPFTEHLVPLLRDGHPTIDGFEHSSKYLDVDELERMRTAVIEDPAWPASRQLAQSYALEHWLDGLDATSDGDIDA